MKSLLPFPKTILLLCFLAIPSISRGDVRLPSFFASSMVIQRDQPVKIWGEADPSERVTVSFSGQKRSTQADQDGHWQVILDPVTHEVDLLFRTMTVQGNNEITLNQIVIGDLWLWAGEKDLMPADPPVTRLVKDQETAKWIRLYLPELTLAESNSSERSGSWITLPQDDVDSKWLPSTFAQKLQSLLGIPVGMMVVVQPKSPIESWISLASLQKQPIANPVLDFYRNGDGSQK